MTEPSCMAFFYSGLILFTISLACFEKSMKTFEKKHKCHAISYIRYRLSHSTMLEMCEFDESVVEL